MENKEQNFFEKYGLEVSPGEVEEGQTYPIYAMITKFINDEPGSIQVELNFNIKAKLNVNDDTKVELLKERAFEPGIFISTVRSKDEGIEVDCHTVVFGKRNIASV